MDTRILRVQHQRGAALVAVYPGLPVDELADLLQAVFQLAAHPLGLAAEDGTILPLSLVCRCVLSLSRRTRLCVLAPWKRPPSSAGSLRRPNGYFPLDSSSAPERQAASAAAHDAFLRVSLF
jgi:hypothetical protein